MRRFLAIAIAFQCARFATAGTLPLTGKDVVLMLKLGYSTETILRDLNARHFGGPLDPSCEAQLRQLNASPALLDALKSGNNAASEEELAQARQKIAHLEVAAEQKAADHTQSPADPKKRDDAYREYLAQLAAAQKLDERVKTVIFSWSKDTGFSDGGSSSDQRRVLHRAQEVTTEEIRGSRRDGWRRVQRIQQLMQDEAFVRDALK